MSTFPDTLQDPSFKTSEESTPSSTLRPITASSGFVFPAIWSFPPFFTLQPNPQTFAHQIGLWTQLLLSWAKFHRVFTLNAGAVDGGDCRDVFQNTAINRRLQPTAIKQFVLHLMKEGLISPDPPQQNSTYLIYWRKPEEWASIIYSWVSDNGLTGSIMTFYELTEGDMAHTTDFYQLPPSLLRRALDVLVKQGKAQVFKGEAAAEGVKFF